MSVRIVAPKEPSVDLIRILSEGTYTSFPQALKEFISNSHDAFATEVELRFHDDFSTLSIRDNGEGMTAQDFTDVFASIARSGNSAPPSAEAKKLKRVKIGRFGIGALAVVGAADKFTITSVKKGSTEGFEASIDLAELRTHYQKGEDLRKVWQFALSEWDNEKPSTHFTEITVAGIRPDIRDRLSRTGLSLNESFHSTSDLSGLEELRWQLGIICPVEYAGKFPIPEGDLDAAKDRILIDKVKALHKNCFSISLEGRPVKNPTSLPAYDSEKVSRAVDSNLLTRRGLGYEVRYLESDESSKVRYKGYIAVQAYQTYPAELRGVLVRLRGVAVGWHRTLNLAATASTMLGSMSGEVWVDGLDEALQFDRESFREDHPLFVWFREKVQASVNEETTTFRARSARRMALYRRNRKSGKKRTKQPKAKAASRPEPASAKDVYLASDIFDKMPEYITRLLPQLNGAFDFEWHESCAMLLRRLAETLVIELYVRRGWEVDVRDPASNEFLMLKSLIQKLNGDSRLHIERRTIDGLERIKDLGNTAAHDFRIRIRRSDLNRLQTAARLSFERLVFKINETAPSP